LDGQGELVRQPLLEALGLDDRQLRAGHPARALEVAHVGADAGVGLGTPVERQGLTVLVERGQHHAIRDGAHQQVEQVHHLRTVGLQLLDHFLAGQQAGLLLVECVDFLDLFVDLGDPRLEEVVALTLAIDLVVVPGNDQERDQRRAEHREAQRGHGFLLALAAPLGAPGQQVDPRHQSKLLRARPQAIISAGASWASARAFTPWRRVMWASGLATIAGTPSCSSTIAAMPGMAALPPASTIWSTRLNSLPA